MNAVIALTCLRGFSVSVPVSGSETETAETDGGLAGPKGIEHRVVRRDSDRERLILRCRGSA